MLITLLLGAALAASSDPDMVSDGPPFPVDPPRPELTGQGEYLVWWLRRGYAPPVLTTSSTASQGVLGQPDTRVLYGDERLETRHNDRFIGARVTLNWQPQGSDFGVEGRGFFLERDSTYYKFYNADGSQLTALSYFDARTGREASEIVSGLDPRRGLLSGGFVGYSRIELFGEEANLVYALMREPGWDVDLLTGARFLQMRDRYHDTATSRTLPDRSVLYGVVDNYRIHNGFYGAEVGLRGEYRYDRWFVQMRGTVALGADVQRVRTFGSRVFHTPQGRTETPVGLFVQPGNSGDFGRGNFDGVGEAAVNVGYDLNKRTRVFVGYTFIYWADPLRAASQIDRVVNQTPGTAPLRPGLPWVGDAFWAQGANVGLEVRW